MHQLERAASCKLDQFAVDVEGLAIIVITTYQAKL